MSPLQLSKVFNNFFFSDWNNCCSLLICLNWCRIVVTHIIKLLRKKTGHYRYTINSVFFPTKLLNPLRYTFWDTKLRSLCVFQGKKYINKICVGYTISEPSSSTKLQSCSILKLAHTYKLLQTRRPFFITQWLAL